MSKADQKRLEDQLHNLKNLAQSRMRNNVSCPGPMRRVGEKVAVYAMEETPCMHALHRPNS
jgi:hypothetical protein